MTGNSGTISIVPNNSIPHRPSVPEGFTVNGEDKESTGKRSIVVKSEMTKELKKITVNEGVSPSVLVQFARDQFKLDDKSNLGSARHYGFNWSLVSDSAVDNWNKLPQYEKYHTSIAFLNKKGEFIRMDDSISNSLKELSLKDGSIFLLYPTMEPSPPPGAIGR